MLREVQPKIRSPSTPSSPPSISTSYYSSSSTSSSTLQGQSFLFVLLFLLGNFSVLIHAQPQPVGGAAAALVGKQWYVQGGALSGDNILQSFWSLDLTKPWTTTQPAWTSLPLGPPNAYHSAGFSADNSTFLTFGRDTAAAPQVIPPHFVNAYNIKSGSWSSMDPAMADNSRRDFVAVTNPSLNRVYFMGGDAGPAGAIASNMFDEYNTATNTLKESTNLPSAPQNLSTYAAAWVPRLNAMMVIGGSSPTGPAPTAIYMYLAATGTWTVQASTGPFVFGRTSACAASNADGSKVIVYGGFIGGSGSADNAIYILDTISWTWTSTAYPGKGRGNAICTIADDTVLIWGGFYASPNTINGTPLGSEALLLFSISKRSWISSYTPTGSFAPAATTTTQPGSGNSTSTGGPSPVPSTVTDQGGISKAAIGGIAAGAAVLLIVIAFALVERQKRIQEKESRISAESNFKNQDENFYSPYVGGTGRSHVPGHYPSQQSPHESQYAMLQHSYPQVPPPRPPPPVPSAIPINQFESLDTQEYGQGLEVPRESRRYSDLSNPGTLQYLPTSDYGQSSELKVVNAGARQSAQSDGSGYFPPPPPLPNNSTAMILQHQDAIYFNQLAQRNNDGSIKRLSNGPHAVVDIDSPFTNDCFPRNGNNPQSLPSESDYQEYSPPPSSQPSHPYSTRPPIALSSVTTSSEGSARSAGMGVGLRSGLGTSLDQYHDHDREREREQESQRHAERAAKHASGISNSDVSCFNPLTLYFNNSEEHPVPPLSIVPKRLSDPQGGYGFGLGDDGQAVLGAPQGLPNQPSRQATNPSMRSGTTASTQRQQYQQQEGYM